VLDLPTDRPRPTMKSYNGATLRVSLGAELTADLRKASARLGCTLYVTLLSAFQICCIASRGSPKLWSEYPPQDRLSLMM